MDETTLHAESITAGGEYTLCGLAFDAHESGDNETPVVFAQPGQTVTCENCKRYIDHIRTNFTRSYRVKKV